VEGQLYQSKLTLAEGLVKFIKLGNVSGLHGNLQFVCPDLDVLLGHEVHESTLVGRDGDLDWVKLLCRVALGSWQLVIGWVLFSLGRLPNVSAAEAVHDFVLFVALAFVKVKFISYYDQPVLLEVVVFTF